MSGRRPWLGLLALAVAAVTAALGVWQVERRAWKHALVASVERKLAASPVPVDGIAAVGADDAYRRVRARGRYRIGADTYVQAVTAYGPGWWVVSPLDTGRRTLLVNRGFVPAERKGKAPPPPGSVTVTGLLRLSEPGGAFLRSNDPAADRWYSRDVPAIAAAKRLGRVAPFFVDQDAAGAPAGGPRGGLTVIAFPDNHLVYALTWFALSAMALFFAWTAWRSPRR
ncbi:SURF1 family protein [Sphingomonas rubra]|uniref:SURF1-like protein n=1 Tax=Sphingomonas rubra TaxID=634430 RepID=A0A1I5QTY7_9SPHN|nr:SURF1 family cytochrome oxidase biogenesis protein [Sphingomonas rubra]SFP49693.1 surfeit locus 1 family protein [Sphingomonas rubra]